MKEKRFNLASNSKLLSFSEQEYKAIQWADDSEFIVNGNMYDLIETERTSDGTYILKAISDDKETGVMKMLEENQDSKSSDCKHAQLLINFFSLYLGALSSFIIKNDEQESKPAFAYIVSFTFPDFNNITPPPRA
jgi:hypothetical protein